MRRRSSMILGGLELVATSLLVLVGWRLPRPVDVERGFGSARELATISRRQIDGAQESVDISVKAIGTLNGVVSYFGDALDVLERLPLPTRFDTAGLRDGIRELIDSGEAAEQRMESLKRDLPRVANELAAVEASLGAYAKSMSQSLGHARVLLWVVAAIVALHGGHLLIVPVDRPQAAGVPLREKT